MGLGLGLVEFWVFELDVLLQGALGPVALVASLHAADIPPLDLLCSPSESLLALRRLPSDVVLEILGFFLNQGRSTSRRPILAHSSSLLCASCWSCLERSEAVR